MGRSLKRPLWMFLLEQMDQSSIEHIYNTLICCACHETLDLHARAPLVSPCGHTMCRSCGHSLSLRACPVCRDFLPRDRSRMPRNFTLLDVIAACSRIAMVGAATPDTGTAWASEQEQIKLLDYVALSPDCVMFGDATIGPLKPGDYGIVLFRDKGQPEGSRPRVLVRSTVPSSASVWWYSTDAVARVAPEDVPSDLRVPVRADGRGGAPAARGAAVTPHTAEPGMLVQRGYDWIYPTDRNGADGEVGVLVETAHQSGLAWKVVWSRGGEGYYRTGLDGDFELAFMQLGAGTGAPVSATKGGIPGTAVTRGTTWRYGERDGGESFEIGTLLGASSEAGCVQVCWLCHPKVFIAKASSPCFDLSSL